MSAWFRRIHSSQGEVPVEHFENFASRAGTRSGSRSDESIVVVRGAMFDLAAIRNVVVEHPDDGALITLRIFYGPIGSTPNLLLRGEVARDVREELVKRASEGQ